MIRFTPFLLALCAQDGEPLPEGAVARLGSRRFHHLWLAERAVYSADGKHLLSGGQHDAAVWDAASGRRIHFARTLYRSQAVGFGLGNIPLALSTGGPLELTNVATGKRIREFREEDGCTRAALSPDGLRIAAAHMNKAAITVYDSLEGPPIHLLRGHLGEIEDLAFSPDGKTLASSAQDKTIRLWDVAGGKEKLVLRGPALPTRRLAFSPDGKTLASSAGDGVVRLWDIAAGTEKEARLRSMGDSLSWAPGSRTVAARSGTVIQVWDTTTDKEFLRIDVPLETGSVAYSPDGKTLVATHGVTFRFWDAERGTEHPAPDGHSGGVWSVGFSPDGKSILAAGTGLVLWDVPAGKARLKIERRSERACLSSDGKLIAAGGYRTIHLIDPQTGRDLRRIEAHPAQVTAMAISPDGSTVASADAGRSLGLWATTDGKELHRLEVPGDGPVRCLSFSPDGKFLVSGAYREKAARVWEVSSGREVRQIEGPGETVLALAFSPDGRRLAIAIGAHVQVVEFATGRVHLSLQGPPASSTAVAFSPDGRILAGAFLDNRVRMWDSQTGKELTSLQGHDTQINAVAFSPDGRWLASGSCDSTILVWTVPR